MANVTERNKKAMVEALQASLGIVTTALNVCTEKGVAVSRTQFYQWMKDDPAFVEQVNQVKEMQLDFAESQLLKKVKLGDATCTIFYLKTQGKGRGYIERSETAILGAIKTNITIE
jgi:hypothetical protein